MLYFKRPWNETRGDEFEFWGKSIWFFETDEKGNILKQIEDYENGPVLFYSSEQKEDKYGGLGIVPLNINEFSKYRISNHDFYLNWKKHT